MGFTEAISSGFSNYVELFGPRVAAREYWYWTLFAIIVSIVGYGDRHLDLSRTWNCGRSARSCRSRCSCRALRWPYAACTIIDRTGWWFLIAFTVIGLILLLVWDCMKGTTGPNQYGPDPIPGG